LKTPLAAMKVLIESLVYQPDMDKKLRIEFLQDVNKEIDRLSAIVSDLLTLVRMDAGSVKLTREKLTLQDLIEENRHRLDPMARKRRQELVIDIKDPCEMNADKGKMNQVIYNLMENAIKYTQDGGEIDVTLVREDGNAVFSVKDNGPGIPADALPHIFERFYRVDKARSRETGGTGLGLSIVKQLIALHDGSVRVESEEGKGSTFIAEIPIKEE
jgi:signal transduction histidine kinase